MGLGTVQVMERLNAQLERQHGVRLAVRAGIHSGLVVVGEMGGGDRQERLVLGDTPNMAARLQGLATPATVIISAATHRPVQGHVVRVLKDRMGGGPYARLECRCSPYYQNSALYPVTDLLQRALQLQREEWPQERLRKLEVVLAPYEVSLPEVVPLLASLLSLPVPDRYPPLSVPPRRQKQKTLEAVLAVLLALAEQRPVLFIVEHLHWVDPSTLELLSLLIDQESTTWILTLLIFRPEFWPPWALHSHLPPRMLSRLPRTQVEVMVEQVAGGKVLPTEVHQQMVAKTDAVPLFVEELTKMVLESGLLREYDEHYVLTGPLPPLAIPTTLHDSLMARLDRLARVKEVAQLGAMLGRAFPYELLQAVAPVDEISLQAALAQLVEPEFLYQRGAPPRATYLLKHTLIQEAAYQSLLKSKRQQYHQQIAQVLEARFPETCEIQPGLLAHHYRGNDHTVKAVVYLQRAGQQAVQRSAYMEALHHLTAALELLKSLPDSSERTQQELTPQIALSVPLMGTKGYAAPELEQAYTRARELCQRMGETPRLFPVLRGLSEFYLVRGELPTAFALGEQLLRLVQSVQHQTLHLGAHTVLGVTLFYLGEFASTRARLEQGLVLYDSQQHRLHASRAAQDPGVLCLSTVSRALWGLGYPNQALERIHEALVLARELAHPHSLPRALVVAAGLPQWCREEQAAQERAEAVITLSTEQGFPFWVAAGDIQRGWALCKRDGARWGLPSCVRAWPPGGQRGQR